MPKHKTPSKSRRKEKQKATKRPKVDDWMQRFRDDFAPDGDVEEKLQALFHPDNQAKAETPSEGSSAESYFASSDVDEMESSEVPSVEVSEEALESHLRGQYAAALEAAEKESSDEEEPPMCPICADWVYPTVVCPACQATFCEQCVLSWANQSGHEGGFKCGVCRHVGGEWKPNRAINDMLGTKKIECRNSGNGCREKISLNAMDNHVALYCPFSMVVCSQSEYGCEWAGFRSTKQTHEATCRHQEWAKTRLAWNAKISECTAAYEGLETQCNLMDAKISEAAKRLEEHKARTVQEIEEVQKLVVKGKSVLYQLRPVDATHVMEVQREVPKGRAPLTMRLQLKVKVDSDNYYISVCAESPKLKYPFFLLGYVVCLNQRAADERAVARFAHRFSRSKQELRICELPRSVSLVAPREHGMLQLQFLCTSY